MDTVISTALIAVTAIIAATVAVCFHVIGSGEWLGVVGAFGGGTAGVHVIAAKSGSA